MDIEARTYFRGLDRHPGFVTPCRSSVMCGLPMKFMADSDINCNRRDGPRVSEV